MFSDRHCISRKLIKTDKFCAVSGLPQVRKWPGKNFSKSENLISSQGKFMFLKKSQGQLN